MSIRTPGLMDAERFEQAVARAGDPAPTAVFPVHFAGQCAAPAALQKAAAKRGCRVVEDAAHAIGTMYKADGTGVAVGSARHAAMTAFSFHAVKSIAMGEGGAVTTNDDELAERLRLMRNHGMARDPKAFQNRAMAFSQSGAANPWYYEMHEPGLNYRATDIQCALAESQLRKLDRFVQRRRALAERYDKLLAPLAPTIRPIAHGRIATLHGISIRC